MPRKSYRGVTIPAERFGATSAICPKSPRNPHASRRRVARNIRSAIAEAIGGVARDACRQSRRPAEIRSPMLWGPPRRDFVLGPTQRITLSLENCFLAAAAVFLA